MGLFSKKYCDICGEKIGMLGNRKLDDGNMCKDCANKLSPWFEGRRKSTVEAIRQQLAYREENKERVRAFRISEDIPGNREHVFIDREHGWFAVGTEMSEKENPDILNLSDITNCFVDTRERREEEKYRDDDNEMRSFSPPRYRYSYDYYMKISVSSPWFDSMSFKLNTFSVDSMNRSEMRRMEDTGNRITESLMRRDAGRPQPMEHAFAQEEQHVSGCEFCGWKAESVDHRPKFCPNCGHPL